MVRIVLAGSDHVNFEDASAKIDLVFSEGLEELIENFASNLSGLVDAVITVVNNLWFNNWHDIGCLAFAGIFGKNLAVGGNGLVGRGEDVALGIQTDFEGAAPFGKTESHLVVFLQALIETV